MAVQDPIAWADIEQALVDWIKSSTGLATVLWAWEDGARPARPYGELEIVSGPVSYGCVEERRTSQISVDELEVTAVAAGSYVATVYVDNVASTPASVVATGAETAEQLRDLLIAEIDGLGLDVTVAVGATASTLTVTGSVGTPHFHIEVSAPSSYLTRTTLAEAVVGSSIDPGVLTVRFTAHSDSNRPADHARVYAHRAKNALGHEVERAGLDAVSLGFVEVASALDLSGLVNELPQTRFAMDFRFNLTACTSRDLPWMRSSTVTGTLTAA